MRIIVGGANSISRSISGFSFSHFKPDFDAAQMLSLRFPERSGSGILINSKSEINAAPNVIRSMAITAPMPEKVNIAVAIIGVSMLVSDCENERIPLVF